MHSDVYGDRRLYDDDDDDDDQRARSTNLN